MPTYLFNGRDSVGELITGKRQAQSVESLGTQLLTENIIPIKIELENDETSEWSQFKLMFTRRKLKLEELAIFCRQMYTLTKAGVTLTNGIRQLGDSASNKALASALQGVAERLEGGQDLASAMQYYPDIFSSLIISMVRVGEDSGKLDEIFLHLYEFLENEAISAKRTKTILRYPTIVLITIIFAIALVNFFVVPAFAKAYAKTNIKLPALTQALISMSNFFVAYWYLLLITVVGLTVGIVFYLKSPKGKAQWDKWQLTIPTVGPIIKRIILLRFAQTFAVVVNAGLPLVEGIALVANSISNEFIRQRILIMHTEIQRGKTLTQAAGEANIFSSLELQMLSISEETGSLGAMLQQIAEFYQREVDYDIKHLTDIIEPVLIFGLSILILGLALAVYLPIWNMVKMVHQ